MEESNPNCALMVDLYELTMAAHFEHHLEGRATFELFVRQLPPERSYPVAAGIDAALDYLDNLHFAEEDVRFLRALPVFRTVSDAFFDYLRTFRFDGDVRAVEEGTIVFAEEPILQVTAPVAAAGCLPLFYHARGSSTIDGFSPAGQRRVRAGATGTSRIPAPPELR